MEAKEALKIATRARLNIIIEISKPLFEVIKSHCIDGKFSCTYDLKRISEDDETITLLRGHLITLGYEIDTEDGLLVISWKLAC